MSLTSILGSALRWNYYMFKGLKLGLHKNNFIFYNKIDLLLIYLFIIDFNNILYTFQHSIILYFYGH